MTAWHNPDYIYDQIQESHARKREADARRAEREAGENKAYAKEIAAKGLADAQCYAAFREHDRVLWVKTRKAVNAENVKTAELALADAVETVKLTEPDAVSARVEYESIAARVADAEEEVAARQADYDRLARDGGPARVQTDALAALTAARGVLTDTHTRLDGPRDAWAKTLAEADSDLAEAREYEADCRKALRVAEANAKAAPGAAPVSDVTIRHNALYMSSGAVYGGLSNEDRKRVRDYLSELNK